MFHIHSTGQAHLKTAPANTHPKFLKKLVLCKRKEGKVSPKKNKIFFLHASDTHFLLTLQRTHFIARKKRPGV